MYEVVRQVVRLSEITNAWEVLIRACEGKRPHRRPELDLTRIVKKNSSSRMCTWFNRLRAKFKRRHLLKSNGYLGSINVVNFLNSCRNMRISRKILFSVLFRGLRRLSCLNRGTGNPYLHREISPFRLYSCTVHSMAYLINTPTNAHTGLFEMIVGVLTTCHTQYTWDRSICVFYLIEQHSKFLLHTSQVLYMCIVCDSTNINTIIEFVPNCL